MPDGNGRRAYVVTFTDLIYAALAAYGLPLFDTALEHHRHWAVAYLGASAVWLFYDWYANHYFAVDENLGGKNIPLDVISFLQYAGLLYAAARTSSWVFLFLAIRGARGIVYNEISLYRGKGPRDAERLRSYNYSSGFMVVAYTPLFVLEQMNPLFSAGVRLGVAVGIWALAYAIALFAEAHYDRRAQAKEARLARARADAVGAVAYEHHPARMGTREVVLAVLLLRGTRSGRRSSGKT